jgi:SAM-dependent methyltransferase
MKPVNSYGAQLTDEAIERGEHRECVGGLWDEIGSLQFEFLVARNLKPDSRFLDVGCGALRGGIHFMNYLDAGSYFGLDINESLIKAGYVEIEKANLAGKRPTLLVDDGFRFSSFGEHFDFALALSVFTHLPMNMIVRCLCEIREVLKGSGLFFATFFEAPSSAHLVPILHQPGDITTNLDTDPFHYSFEEITMLADLSGLNVRLIGDWDHPRAQRMLEFSRKE